MPRAKLHVPPPPFCTPMQEYWYYRNALIVHAARLGFKQRQLAVAFALPHSRIAAIIKQKSYMYPENGRDSPQED